MTTTPHLLTGAALASLLPTGSAPVKLLGFALGFASHYLLDAVPHWERLYGAHYNDELAGPYDSWPRHVAVQGLADALAGCLILSVVLALMVPEANRLCVFLGAFGAVFPDLMDSAPWWAETTKRWPVWRYFTKFHDWAHMGYDLQRRLPSWLGLVSQVAVIIAALLVLTLC